MLKLWLYLNQKLATLKQCGNKADILLALKTYDKLIIGGDHLATRVGVTRESIWSYNRTRKGWCPSTWEEQKIMGKVADNGYFIGSLSLECSMSILCWQNVKINSPNKDPPQSKERGISMLMFGTTAQTVFNFLYNQLHIWAAFNPLWIWRMSYWNLAFCDFQVFGTFWRALQMLYLSRALQILYLWSRN